MTELGHASPDHAPDPLAEGATGRVARLLHQTVRVKGRLLQVGLHEHQGGLSQLEVIERRELFKESEQKTKTKSQSEELVRRVPVRY